MAKNKFDENFDEDIKEDDSLEGELEKDLFEDGSENRIDKVSDPGVIYNDLNLDIIQDEEGDMARQVVSRKEKPRLTRRKIIKRVLFAGGVVGAFGGLFGIYDHFKNEGYTRRKIFSGLGLRGFELTVKDRRDYPYSFSPWQRYAELENNLLAELDIPEDEIPRLGEKAIEIGNEISDRVSRRILMAGDKYAVADIVKRINVSDLMKMIAEEMIMEDIFYTEESLLSSSFNETLHRQGGIHLDCDLITYLMCHVASRLDIGTTIVSGPMHAYLFVNKFGEDSGYVIEPTEFRRIERRGGVINLAGAGIGKDFFSSFEKQRERSNYHADERFEKAAMLHVPIDEEQRLNDMIFSQVLAGLNNYAVRKEDLELRIKILEKAIPIAERGSDDYIFVSNFFQGALRLADELINEGRYNEAIKFLVPAVSLKNNKGSLIIIKEPLETILLGKVFWEIGEEDKAREELRYARRFYEETGGLLTSSKGRYARNLDHAKLLTYSALSELDTGRYDKDEIYHNLVVPALNQFNQYSDKEKIPEYLRARMLEIKLRN